VKQAIFAYLNHAPICSWIDTIGAFNVPGTHDWLIMSHNLRCLKQNGSHQNLYGL